MRKFLSLVLAILMVASLTVVGVSAEETAATVTITGFNNESSDTQTYKVGETFTAYVYLNASGLNTDGMIGALKAVQYYSKDVLELAEAYDAEDGMIEDLDTMFPITKGATVANGSLEDHISFNASTPSMVNAFKFNSDEAALIVARYTVKSAGTATITNDIITLAISDMYLTKAVHKSQVFDDNFKVYVKLSAPQSAPAGSTVSGTVTSFNDKTEETEDVTVELLQGEDVKYTATVNGNTVEYSIAGVADGDYTLRVSKKNHVTRDYEITVSGDTTADAKIQLIGDVSGDGLVNTTDAARANVLARKLATFDEYTTKVADVSGDGIVNTTDCARINNHARGLIYLWK